MKTRLSVLVAAALSTALGCQPARLASSLPPRPAPAGLPAPTPDLEKSAEVDALVRRILADERIPGATVVVLRKGRTVLSRGYGFANVEHEVPVADRTLFQSGSMGKQFTAVLVLLLVQDGAIKLDDRIEAQLPTLRDPAMKAITWRHLLTHTSGLSDYPHDFDLQRERTEDELLEMVLRSPMGFVPGARHAYSNLGYVLLGVLVRKVTGRFYGDLLEERVFRPLGMETAQIISEARIVPNRASGYELRRERPGVRPRTLQNQAWVATSLNTTADGSLYLSGRDIAQWERGLTDRKLLSAELYDAMWTPVRLNDGKTHPYGFGWSLAPVNDVPSIQHDGAWQGFRSHIARFPTLGLTVATFANLRSAPATRIALEVAALYEPSLATAPQEAWTDASWYNFQMSAKAAITRANVQAFLGRPWDALARSKQQHWRDALRADPLATFRASEALWEVLQATGHTTNPAERQADLDAHLRLRALLDRTANVQPR